MDRLNVVVEYLPRKIDKCAVQCPKCSKWFNADDVLPYAIHTEAQLRMDTEVMHREFNCPCCGYKCESDNYIVNISENVDFPQIVRKKVSWE